MHDTTTATVPLVERGAIQRIVVQPALLASDPDTGAADGIDALTQIFRAQVEHALRRRLACYAPQIEVDWSAGIGAAGPRGLAAITYGGDVLDAEDERLLDPRCDACDAIMHAVDHCE
jgi:hypothetical protein